MDRINAHEATRAAQMIGSLLPEKAKRSTTLNNGSEHVGHSAFGVTKIYFADPYASWKKGGNENGNLWIRYYFPKRANFATIPAEELREVEWELNNRTRKHLKFKIPQEVFDEYLMT